jgi:hypothetical protein
MLMENTMGRMRNAECGIAGKAIPKRRKKEEGRMEKAKAISKPP